MNCSHIKWGCYTNKKVAATTSIIITVYNRERYLTAAMESVLAQTESDLELLIWDDGSTDNSLKIAQYYASRDRRVRVVAAEHLGRSSSLQAAHAQANGIYVGWLDSDDRIAPTALEETVSVLNAHPEVGLVYTDHLIIDALDKVKGYGQRCRIPYSKGLCCKNFLRTELSYQSAHVHAGTPKIFARVFYLT